MATKWTIDPAHSELEFKVKHMMISYVTGTFREFSGTVEADSDDFNNAKISFEAQVKSIDTRSLDRDKHLQSADFFDAEKFPVIKFVSTSFVKTGEDDFDLAGNLTIKDITVPIKFEVEYGGEGKDPWGNVKAGFELKGKLNRKDFGLTWNTVIESGGVLVGDEVKLNASIQLIKSA